ncbi:MAG: DUF5808 domain-containing protein [Coriobacteriales bacterium]|jgi:uncharacterized membrane protein|nr:DUF5808 domain-containing protein [Coriobacteriales bacterium]
MPTELFVVFILLMDILLIVSFAFVPYVTRKTELFGVSIPSEQTRLPQLMRERAIYRNQLLVGGAVLVILSLLLIWRTDPSSPWMIGIWLSAACIYLLAAFLLYLPRHRALQRIKQEQGWDAPTQKSVVIADTTPYSKDTIHPAWNLLYLPVLALWSLAMWWLWPTLPDMVPTHYNAAGEADAWTPKGPSLIWVQLAIYLFMAIIMIGCYFIIRHSRRQNDAAKPLETLEQEKRFRRLNSIFVLVVGLLTLIFIEAMFLYMMVGGPNATLLWASVIAYLAIVAVGVVLLMVFVGQGGSRLRSRAQQQVSQVNYDDDRFWKLGLFYCNRDDPALFVEKRFGIGWTSNFARPLNWVLITGLLVLIAALLVITITLSA